MGNADSDLAPLMVFLASDGSGYINGQVFAVNGGANMVRYKLHAYDVLWSAYDKKRAVVKPS